MLGLQCREEKVKYARDKHVLGVLCCFALLFVWPCLLLSFFLVISCHWFQSHPRQLIFIRKSDCLGCAVFLLPCCLFDLAHSFFLLHLSLTCTSIWCELNVYISNWMCNGVCHDHMQRHMWRLSRVSTFSSHLSPSASSTTMLRMNSIHSLVSRWRSPNKVR